MSSPGSPPPNPSDTAFWYHAALAAIVCIALAMQVYLWAIEASPEVAGGGMFLVAIWLGLPAILLILPALYFSVRAGETLLVAASVLLVALSLALVSSAPVAVPVGVAYVCLVLNLGLRRRRRFNSV